jgi:hypothetical protein
MSKVLRFIFIPVLCCLCLVLAVSCHTTKKRNPGKPFTVKVAPKPVRLGSSFEGNSYEIVGYAAQTNNGAATNLVWPKRVHIDLSLNGGTNYSRRIGYGIPSESNFVYYTYSLPWWDTSLLTENAMLRITDLAGTQLGTSFKFIIAGFDVTSPAAGDVLVPATTVDLTWTQAGAGPEVEMGYITPANETWVPFITFSNCVAGVNTISWEVTLPGGLSQAKLVLRSVSHPQCIGYSGIISTP